MSGGQPQQRLTGGGGGGGTAAAVDGGMAYGQEAHICCLALVNEALYNGLQAARRVHPEYTHPINVRLLAGAPHPKVSILAFTGSEKVLAEVPGVYGWMPLDALSRLVEDKAASLIRGVLGKAA